MFRRKKKPAPPVSPARQALLAADAALADGRLRLSEAEQRVARLRAAVDAEAPARRALADALGSGEEAMGLVSTAQAAETAARSALTALPSAEAAVQEANEALGRLIEARSKAVDRALIAEADSVGREYAKAFDRLMRCYERLCGIDAAVSGKLAFSPPQPQEMPRFRLPSLPTPHERQLDGSLGTGFGTFLTVRKSPVTPTPGGMPRVLSWTIRALIFRRSLPPSSRCRARRSTRCSTKSEAA
jgi:primosomal protein N''